LFRSNDRQTIRSRSQHRESEARVGSRPLGDGLSMGTRLAWLAIIALSPLQAAELGDQEMSIGFDYSEIDMRKDEHHFRGNVSISQGPVSITSETAMARGAAQNDSSRWTFERDVHV